MEEAREREKEREREEKSSSRRSRDEGDFRSRIEGEKNKADKAFARARSFHSRFPDREKKAREGRRRRKGVRTYYKVDERNFPFAGRGPGKYRRMRKYRGSSERGCAPGKNYVIG